MGTNDRLNTKPPLPPKPQIIGGVPQEVLDAPPSSTNKTSGTQYRPTPKPRLHKPGSLNNTLNQVGDTDQASLCNTDSAASSMSHFYLPISLSKIDPCPFILPKCVCLTVSNISWSMIFSSKVCWRMGIDIDFIVFKVHNFIYIQYLSTAWTQLLSHSNM